MLGRLLSLAGAVLALWLVREREIEREPAQDEPTPEAKTEAALEPADA